MSTTVERSQTFLKAPGIVHRLVLVPPIGIFSRFALGSKVLPSQRITVSIPCEYDLPVISLFGNCRFVLTIEVSDLGDIAFFVIIIFDQMDAILIDRRPARQVKVRTRPVVAVFIIGYSIFMVTALKEHGPVVLV